jgi:hypothetical protein
MQTIYSGFGLPTASNLVLEEAFRPLTLVVALNDLPIIPTRIQLPTGTHGLTLHTPLESVWWALDEDPGPIPADPLQGNTIAESAFTPGGVVVGGTHYEVAVPQDSQLHVLHLLSRTPAALLTVTIKTEYTA